MEEISKENQLEESVENVQVADVQPAETQGENPKTEKDAFYADKRRKQELEDSRATIAQLEEKLGAQSNGTDAMDFLNRITTKGVMENDLKEIQSIDPKITSLEDLPEMFLALRFNTAHPMGAKQAFLAMRAVESRLSAEKPTSTGSMNSTGTAHSDYYTSAELDSLSAKDLDNPKVFEKRMKSMARLR